MTKQQEKEFEKIITAQFKEQHLRGMKTGARGILGAVLNMCNENKSIEEIKQFCETSLNLEGMK